MKAALQAILTAARTGHGSYGPNYDAHKLAEGITALMAQLDAAGAETTAPAAPARAPATSPVGLDETGVPQPYSDAVVLLEAIAQTGALAFFDNGAPTPMREMCQRSAAELHREGRRQVAPQGSVQARPARIRPVPVIMDGVIELCALDKNGLLVAIAPESVKAPASWASALQRAAEAHRDHR